MLILTLCFVFVIHTINCLPNFVFILTDDQDLTLNTMSYMKNATNLIANQGVTFTNFFVNTPICCPSRSTILTGKYIHNLQVYNNSISGGCSSRNWQNNHEKHTIASLLKSRKNYKTFFAGKYLNQYGNTQSGGVEHVPFGYDWWLGLKGNSRYYNYTLSINGSGHFFQNNYLTDLITDYGLDFLDSVGSNENFFMMLAPPACHAPFTPAPRHLNLFPELKTPRSLPFNSTPFDKHWLVQMPPTSLPSTVDYLDDIYRDRIRTLQSVDDMIGLIIEKLENNGILNNTYVIFTSDNGFHIGQFTQPWDKRQPYESDIRTPFIIRGPKIPQKKIQNYPVSAVDIAPTILSLANLTMQETDGISFKNKLFRFSKQTEDRFLLVEYWGEGNAKTVDPRCPWNGDNNLAECFLDSWCKCEDSKNNTYHCIRELSNDKNNKFCVFSDNFQEVYNLTADPYEIINLYKNKTLYNQFNIYSTILEELRQCKGFSCRIKV